jgi:hypothetical protein
MSQKRTRSPRLRAFESNPDWKPAPGMKVYVRSRVRHLSRVCSRGVITSRRSLIEDLVEVTIRSGGCIRTEMWFCGDLRPISNEATPSP